MRVLSATLNLFVLLFATGVWVLEAGAGAPNRAQVAVDGQAPAATASPTPTVYDDPQVVRAYQDVIRPDRLYSLLHYFASDSFMGRETGTAAHEEAARFLAETYREIGLTPAPGTSRDGADAYMQYFTLYGSELYNARLQIFPESGPPAALTFDPQRPGKEMYLAAGALPSISGDVEFIGRPDANESIDYEDYGILHPGHAAKGAAWALSFAPESLLEANESVGPYRSSATWAKLTLRIAHANNEPLPLGFILVASDERVARESVLAARAALSVGPLSLEPGTPPYGFPPVYVVAASVAETMLAGTGYTLEKLRGLERENGADTRISLPGLSLSSHIDFPVRPFETQNVAAFIEGVDPDLRHEVVVITSHYDHIGENPLLPGDGIFNGADDDGSGNVSMLEIARAFVKAREDGVGPRRSVAFVHFTGEEKGLLGSRYYADTDPLFPIDHTIANINLDMIGRADPIRAGDGSYVYVIGSRLISQELHDISERVNELTGLGIELDERYNSTTDPNRYYKRSDHWNFGKYGVPFIFFFTGPHSDYHRPSDESHLIDYDRMTGIARLVFATAWQVANQDVRPRSDGTGLN